MAFLPPSFFFLFVLFLGDFDFFQRDGGWMDMGVWERGTERGGVDDEDEIYLYLIL